MPAEAKKESVVLVLVLVLFLLVLPNAPKVVNVAPEVALALARSACVY